MIKVKGLEIDVGYCFKNVVVTSLLGYRSGHNYVGYTCVCGSSKEASVYQIIKNEDYNCGCLNRVKTSVRKKTHGLTKSSEYKSWSSAKERCYNINNGDYPEYGGRGITVCDRWLNSFESFLEDMGERPKGFSLDRIDTDKGYSPENCRWADAKTQAYNRRRYSFNISGKSGVTWNKKASRWEVRISKDCKEYYLGFFTILEDAIKCREAAEIELYGYIK